MHTKMVRYERVVSVSLAGSQSEQADVEQELNHKRLRTEPYELCQALEETVKGDSVSCLPFQACTHLTRAEIPSVAHGVSHTCSSDTRAVSSRCSRILRVIIQRTFCACRTGPGKAVRLGLPGRSEIESRYDASRTASDGRSEVSRARVSKA